MAKLLVEKKEKVTAEIDGTPEELLAMLAVLTRTVADKTGLPVKMVFSVVEYALQSNKLM